MGDEAAQVHRRARSSAVTIADVAKKAQVSTATVSRTLAGAANVNPAMAERVMSAARDLDYRPSDAARVLASGAHRKIGVIIPDASNPYFFEVVNALLTSARAAGFRVLIADSQGDENEELALALDLARQVDGLAMVSPRLSNDGLRTLAAQPTPIVLANRLELGITLPMVVVDNFHAMTEMCGHLAVLGHRNVVYVGGPQRAWQEGERWRAIANSAAFGIEAVRLTADGSIEAGRAATDAALRHHPTAVICFNDLTALGVMSRLRELHINVPGDISVTGFDDIELARWNETPVTTAVSPQRDLGEILWSYLDPSAKPGPQVTTLQAPIVIRGSTGPAPAPQPV